MHNLLKSAMNLFCPWGLGHDTRVTQSLHSTLPCGALYKLDPLETKGLNLVRFTCRHLILTKLGHSDRYLDHYSGTNNGGVRGHDGVTGVKKVIFTKKASSPTEYLALTGDLCICISLTPSTKVITLKIHLGSLGVTVVKRSFSPKRHQVLQNT